MFKNRFKITNLDCTACVSLSKHALKDIPGVMNVEVDFASGIAEIKSDRKISWNEIAKSLAGVEKNASFISES